MNRAHAVAEIRILRALGPLPRRPRRGRLPRQLQPDAIRLSYFGALVRMVEAARDQVLAALKPRFAEFAAAYAPTRHDAVRADALDFNAFFDEIADGFWRSWTNTRLAELARSMAGRTSAFQKEQLGKQFKAVFGIDILKIEPWLGPKIEAFTAENVGLVKSIPTRFFADVESQIVRGMREGLRWEELASTIEERTGVAESSAKLVARDQVGKFMAGVNEERQAEMGVSRYVWRGAMDNRERESHVAMEGKVCAWDDPPLVDGEHVHPGEPILCRCEAEPVLDDLIAEITDEPRGDARLDWNEEDVVRVPAGQPGGGQFGAGRHTEQNPVPPLHPGAKAKLTKLQQKAVGEVQEHPSKLVAEPSSGLTPKETGEERSPVAKAPAHWGQEETSVKQPGHEYGSQIPMNPVTGKPYAGEKTEVAPVKAAPSAPKAAPEPQPAAPSKPAPASVKPPPLPSKTMNPGHKATHTKLVKAGKHEEAAAYLQKFGGEPAPSAAPQPAAFTLEHLPVTRNALESHLAGEIPQKADQELKSKTMVAFNAWQKTLTGKQNAAMEEYKGSGYKWMNKMLRENTTKDVEAVALRALTTALETAPETPRGFVVWRGIRYDALATDPVGHLTGLAGVIHDNGFVSTSFSVETAKSFSGSDKKSSVLMRIQMPAGTRTRYWSGESELLVQRDAKFRIEKVYKTSDGFTVLDGRYIGSSPAGLSQRGAKHDSADVAQAGGEKFCWTEADFASGGVWIE